MNSSTDLHGFLGYVWVRTVVVLFVGSLSTHGSGEEMLLSSLSDCFRDELWCCLLAPQFPTDSLISVSNDKLFLSFISLLFLVDLYLSPQRWIISNHTLYINFNYDPLMILFFSLRKKYFFPKKEVLNYVNKKSSYTRLIS